MASVYALYMQVKQAMESGRPAWSMRLSPFRSGVDISALVGERSLFLFGPRRRGLHPPLRCRVLNWNGSSVSAWTKAMKIEAN